MLDFELWPFQSYISELLYDFLCLMSVPFLSLVLPVFVTNAMPFVKYMALTLWLIVSAFCYPQQTAPNHSFSIDFSVYRPLYL